MRKAFRGGRGRCGAPGCRNPYTCEECECCEECCICELGNRRAWELEAGEDPDSMEDDDQPFFWNR